MSYILDALRRADAERERGGVPSLHSQQYGALPVDDDEPRPPRLMLTVIVVLVLVLGSAVAWNFWGGRDATNRGAVQAGAITAPPNAATTTPPVALPPAPATVTATAPMAPAPAPPPEAPTSTTDKVATDGPEAGRRLRAAAASMKAERRGGSASTGPLSSAPKPAAPAAARSSSRQLPDAMRRELPALAFGGASYSKDPTSRMVIFNGRVFHEGDVIAPDLVLQEIRNKAAVFSYRGYVYEMAF